MQPKDGGHEKAKPGTSYCQPLLLGLPLDAQAEDLGTGRAGQWTCDLAEYVRINAEYRS